MSWAYVFLCAFLRRPCVHLRAFLCAFRGRFRGHLWLLCVHFSQFCDLMGIQILHNIRLWHHVAYIFAARMAEYISAFRYILNKWCKCVNGPSRPYKAKKNNNCICDLKCGQITLQHFFNLRFISTPPFSNRFVFDWRSFLTRLPGDQQRTRQNIKSVYCNGGFCLVMTMGD